MNDDAAYCISVDRKPIPYSNMEETIIHIEPMHLPNEFLYELAELVKKYAPG
jgi:hypothetical protein